MTDNPHLEHDPIRKPVENRLGMHLYGYKSKRELARESITDGLTGLLNKKGWELKTSEYIRHSQRTRENISFIVIDLDDLKAINDANGHIEGDKILIGLSEKLGKLSRMTDIVARLGGDEFGICLPGTSVGEAQVMKRRLMTEKGDINLSVGVGKNFNEADINMYKMKQHHKDNKNG